MRMPFDLALAHFGNYSTEVIRAVYMETFHLVRKHPLWMSHAIFAAALGCGSLRLLKLRRPELPSRDTAGLGIKVRQLPADRLPAPLSSPTACVCR